MQSSIYRVWTVTCRAGSKRSTEKCKKSLNRSKKFDSTSYIWNTFLYTEGKLWVIIQNEKKIQCFWFSLIHKKRMWIFKNNYLKIQHIILNRSRSFLAIKTGLEQLMISPKSSSKIKIHGVMVAIQWEYWITSDAPGLLMPQ